MKGNQKGLRKGTIEYTGTKQRATENIQEQHNCKSGNGEEEGGCDRLDHVPCSLSSRVDKNVHKKYNLKLTLDIGTYISGQHWNVD